MAEFWLRPVRAGRSHMNRLKKAARVSAAAARLGSLVAAGRGALRRWRHRHTGDAVALDLSPMVARPAELVGEQSRRGSGWPTGVQEDDDFRWRWDSSPDHVSPAGATDPLSASSWTRSVEGLPK